MELKERDLQLLEKYLGKDGLKEYLFKQTQLEIIRASVRPILTILIIGLFMIALIIGLYTHQLSYKEFLLSISGTVSTLIGFWFGERAALKNPNANNTLD